MESAFYVGQVRHRRFSPREHSFTYPLFMVYLRLDELDRVFGRSWLWSCGRPSFAWVRRSDFFGDSQVPLDDAVRDLVMSHCGTRPDGPIAILTHARFLGFSFNPVSFYYCFDHAGGQLRWIVAEITNTPWRERHQYVLDVGAAGAGDSVLEFEFAKHFHVSPFLPMDLRHRWLFRRPGRQLTVHMEDHHGNDLVFDATLTMKREAITPRSMRSILWRFPLMSLQVVAGIYIQALKLFLKRITYYPHPGVRTSRSTVIGRHDS